MTDLGVRRLAGGAAIAATLLAGDLAAQLRLVPFDVRVPHPPTPVVAQDSARLAYELRITNLSSRDLAVGALEVLDPAGRVLARWAGDPLKAAMIRIAGGGPEVDGRVIPGGRQSLAYVWVSVSPRDVPKTLSHRLLVTHPDSLAGPRADSLVGPSVAVNPGPALVFESPFEGGGVWLAGNGPGNTSGHRRTAIPLGGQARIAQRFAIDWVKLGPDGRLFRGDSTRNENWYGYDVPLLAVMAGTVVATKDGIPENVPLAPNRAVPVTLETVGGNYVIIEVAPGRYAFYAHLVPGSLRVAVGDRVRAGQPIGRLGNSGNSDAPHLHLHLGDSPTPLGSEGLPVAFARFRLLGRAASLFAPAPMEWLSPTAGTERRSETPLESDVIRFP